ncbi:Orsellinic acid synthase [Metarhizium brunneum]|uniref:Orsellinic acid synthase n=1 Tax=Metarhizium brunneum TaxID=500148 RepID=A0A7D5Z5G3_9HYPO|nr:Orsellinic acid synthase [Metarhizium brunneum]
MGAIFAQMGMDSQMRIDILFDFKKATTVKLPAAFFTNFPRSLMCRKNCATSNRHISRIMRERPERPERHRGILQIVRGSRPKRYENPMSSFFDS